MRRPARVLLITPPYQCGMIESAGVWMPLGLAYLAGSVRAAGFEPRIYDAMSLFHEIDRIAATVADHKPDVVAVTAYTATIGAALDVLRAAKRVSPDVVTVVGGVHPTFMASDVLADPAVDYVVHGEGEQTLPELLECLASGDAPVDIAGLSFKADGDVVHTPDRELIQDLDPLPVAWDLIDWPIYHYRTKPGSRLGIASWSRGCTEACTFCSQQKLWRRTWRPRRVESVVSEAKMLAFRYGVDTLEVADECPTTDAERWEAILDRLIEEDLGIELLVETRADHIVRDAAILHKYRDAGILHMYVGVESCQQDRLDLMRKNLQVEQSREAIRLLNEVGIITETSFLLGFPQDTPETVERTVQTAIDYDPDLAFFIAATPWPYSEMCEQFRDRIEEHDFSKYNFINPIIRPDAMSRQELSALLGKAFMSFYSRKMSTLGSMPVHKREYLMAVAKLLMNESYLAEEVKLSLGGARPAGHSASPPVHGHAAEHSLR